MVPCLGFTLTSLCSSADHLRHGTGRSCLNMCPLQERTKARALLSPWLRVTADAGNRSCQLRCHRRSSPSSSVQTLSISPRASRYLHPSLTGEQSRWLRLRASKAASLPTGDWSVERWQCLRSTGLKCSSGLPNSRPCYIAEINQTDATPFASMTIDSGTRFEGINSRLAIIASRNPPGSANMCTILDCWRCP